MKSTKNKLNSYRFKYMVITSSCQCDTYGCVKHCQTAFLCIILEIDEQGSMMKRLVMMQEMSP